MSFTQETFAPIGGQTTNTPASWTYKTSDILSDVLLPNYFELKKHQLEISDLIWVKAIDRDALISYMGPDTNAYIVAPREQPELILFASSLVDQEPTALDTPIQVSFGDPQSNEDLTLDANGKITVLKNGLFSVVGTFDIGRKGSSGGVSVIFARLLIDGQPTGNTVATLIDGPSIVIPEQFELTLSLIAGQELAVEIQRDSSGVNEGGIFSIGSSTSWADSPSASVRVSRIL